MWDGLPHNEKKINKKLINNLIAHKRAWMLQNCYDWDCGYPTNFWFIIKDHYDESEYSKKVRKYIQKANDKFIIGLISKTKLAEEGYAVWNSNYSKYTVHDGYKETPKSFQARIDRLTDKYEIWGCIDKDTGKLEAYSICRIEENVCFFESSKANPEFLTKYYPFYGMYDARNRHYLSNVGLLYCVSGARSISEHSNIQKFLIEKMLFRKAYCRMDMHYVWWMCFMVKLLYPCRNILRNGKLKSLLNMEYIARGEI